MSSNPLAPSWLRVPADANALPENVWSMGASRDSSGELVIAGVRASDLAAEFGTPLYVVDEADARTRASRIRTSFDREFARVGSSAKVYYAGKAFLSTEVARWVTEEGLNIDVASGGELAVALAAGVDAARLGLHGNNKSLAEIDRAVEVGVGAIVIDSVVEIERVAQAAARRGVVQRVRLRINSGVHASTHEYLATAREDQKFGIPLADAPAVVAQIRTHPELEFLGLHSHIGSQIFESDGFAEAAHRLFDLHARLLEGGPVPELNLGGGFGIAYTSVDEPLDVEEIAKRFADIVAEGAASFGVPVPIVAIEPGRSVIGPSTTTLYRVGTIKDVEVTVPGQPEQAEQSSAVRKYVSVDGGMSDNIRPSLYGADYSARIASRFSSAEPALVRVAGKHCESGDIVVHAEYLPADVAPDDLLAVPATGAYGWAMASNYNYLARPPVVAVRDGRARVIVRGETESDLLSRDAGIAAAPAPNLERE
ncbi:diaminopimelate decarboxylase [Microbacteriaceae bacterium SG_E_30_P1]|uniref:Diaminopimelate decarboxylase n=1 Tax=Antiquaquibacter oligotrophicus TaxID=2880260 RepID=A0ABT6KKK6_9MICO|nr:diaminopimelate decarboxylase [Antiquaquibacter oligotrophicus]MDH6180540.1 diaminopimelate decarboxylase [Antiquaquibacter oligotrophicus]UDF13726.1 diaminopimelate decarboxylase [Antiquaquibacter oligotrophicus]